MYSIISQFIFTAVFIVFSILNVSPVLSCKRQHEEEDNANKSKLELALKRYASYIETITDPQAVQIFREALISSSYAPEEKDEVVLALVGMHRENRTSPDKDNALVPHLEKILNNKEYSQCDKDFAASGLGWMFWTHRTDLITEDKAFLYFTQASNSKYLNQRDKTDAANIRSDMCKVNPKLLKVNMREGQPL